MTPPRTPWPDPAQPIVPDLVAAPAARPGALPIERLASVAPRLNNLWLVKGLLASTGLAVIFGHPGSGKTFYALEIGFHVALNWNWHGRRVNSGLVIYVAAEGVNGLRNRISAWKQHHGVSDAPFSLIPCAIDLQGSDADVSRLADAIDHEAQHYGVRPAMLIVDTLSKTFGAGQENTDDMAAYVGNCQKIAERFECCVVVVHHRPRDSSSQEPRGHSSLKGGVETVILIEGTNTRSATVVKQKDGDEGDRFLFDLQVVELGKDEDGEPVTSCVIVPADAEQPATRDPFQRAVGKLSAGTRIAFEMLGEVLTQRGTAVPADIPDTEIDRLRVGKVVLLDAWRDKCISAAGTEVGHVRDTAKRTFNRNREKLVSLGLVRVWNDFAWITFALPGHVRDKYRDSTGTPGQPGHTS